LSPAEVLSRFAGVRPLIHERPGAPSDLSREFELVGGPGGLLTAAGGKYTTYRNMAEVITDAVAARLGLRARCRTADLKLDGTPARPWADFVPTATAQLAGEFGLERKTAAHLIDRYGRRAEDVAAAVREDSRLLRRVVADEPEIEAEFVYHREQEMAEVPADYLLRRTRLGLFHPELLHHPPAVTKLN